MSVLSLDLRDQVYAIDNTVTQRSLADSSALNASTYSQKTQAVAFQTSQDIDRLQVIYEQGGVVRGFNLFIENGKLYAGLWNKSTDGSGEVDWGYLELDTNVQANTRYSAALVLDGTDNASGRAQLYLNGNLVDTVTGVGRLYSHTDDTGIGQVSSQTRIHDQAVGRSSNFSGTIETIAQYNDALFGAELAELNDALGNNWVGTPADPSTNSQLGSDVSSVVGSALDLPQAPVQNGGNQSDGGNINNTDITGGSVRVTGGRVTTLDIPQNNVADVRIISNVNHGNVTVNPDNSLALVMTGSNFTGSQSFRYEVTYNNGSTSTHTVNLNVSRGSQREGWGTGEDQYMLATDANDKVIAEAGDNHIKVYVSGSRDALSFADIARMEGIPTSRVNGNWLANQDRYGQSEDLALDATAGRAMWNVATPAGSSSSNHLLFERGYEYRGFNTLVNRGARGEEEINPILIGAYGEGDKPIMLDGFGREGVNQNIENIVFQDLDFARSVKLWNGQNIIFDNVTLEGRDASGGAKSSFSNVDGLTFHNSELYDIWRTEAAPRNGPQAQSWHDRTHGIYAEGSDGILLEGNFFDQIGWNPNYNPNSLWGGGQSPSMWSHNVYLQFNNNDVTVRDNISMRASSDGLKIRSGGYADGNVLIDNNIGIVTHGGDYRGSGAIGNYSLFSDNLVTSAGARTAQSTSATAWGVWDGARDTTHVDNVITHFADPDSSRDLNVKRSSVSGPIWGDHSDQHRDYYNDTIVYNWTNNPSSGAENQNLSNLDRNALDDTTIQSFAQELLGNPNAGIDELSEYIKANSDGQLDTSIDADIINRFFQEGFGIASDVRSSATTLRFVPNELGDGVRWDNKLNWSTNDDPGMYAADRVDLGGNNVVFGTTTVIDMLDLSGGELTIYGGRLVVTGGIVGEGGIITVEGAGQLFIDGNSGGRVTVNVTGGRFVNTGSGANLRVNDRGGEVINDRTMDLTDFIPDHAVTSSSSNNGGSQPSPAPQPDPVSLDSIDGVSNGNLVYAYLDGIDQNTIPEAANHAYLEKTQVIAFETGNNVDGLQMLYDQGWGNRGFNLFIENGKLYAGLYDNAQQNWGYRELEADIAANTKYTAALVIDGARPADGTADLYLNGERVDTIDGVGQLQEHGTLIGVGGIHEYTVIHGTRTNQVEDFQGNIAKLAQYHDVLNSSDLSALNDVFTSGYTVPVQTPQEPYAGSVFSFTDGSVPNGIADDPDINMGSYLEKTQGIAFETGSDVSRLQVLYEQGGGIRGLNMFVENGKLYAAVWNRAEENWGYRELEVDISANSKYTAMFIMNGQEPSNGIAELYLNGNLVDSVDGIGRLYQHGNDIGIGQVAQHTVIHGQDVSDGSEFSGTIETLVQYNDALEGENLTQFSDYLADNWVYETAGLSVEPVFSFTDGNTPNRLQDDLEINMGSFLQKTHGMAFETGSNINNLQMLYEQGGGTRGLNMFIENGKLYAAVWNKAEENWGYRELKVDIAANTRYTATLVMDGKVPSDGMAELYLNSDLIGSVSGVGRLYGHSDDIGIGEVNNHTVVHNRFFNRSADFTGEIEAVVQYNDALTGNDLSALHAVLAEGYLNVAETSAPIIEPAPKPVVQPAPEPEPEPVVSEPVVEAKPEPTPQPAPKPPVDPQPEQPVYEETNKNDETSGLKSLSKVFEEASLGDVFVDLNEIQGTSGNDFLRGALDQSDLIDAGAGNDHIFSEDGDDVIRGGAGDDRIYGMGGNDIIHGGAGNDQILGGPGDDIIILGEGRDRVWGDQGKDTFVFESFDAHVDTIFGFETGADGDVINLTDILKDFDPLMDDILNFVQISDNNGNAEIQVNTGNSFETIAVVQGEVAGMTVNDLVEAGNLVVDQAVYSV